MSNSSTLQPASQEHNFILFAQHGWADTYHDIAYLAKALASEQTIVYTPDLGWTNTWLTIAPLIDKVEKIALEAIAAYPDLPLRIVGHSMGGLIWLEVLNRHPEWLTKVHSLVLVGSPLGGSDLGRLFDPFGWFPLIARDLGTNRRPIAEAIAAQIPTASIVGDIGNNTDGTVPIGCSQFAHANFFCLDGLRHPTLKNHPRVATTIQSFWQNPQIAPRQTDTASQLIAKLRSLDLTETDFQNFSKAKLIKTYPDQVKLWQWQSALQITHVFVSISDKYQDKCIYSAYAGWRDRKKLAEYLT
ncbi:alpha/beta fold hydrolase [Pseudanabaena sp. FACHB-1998]|uniref:alpha/beta hydrolase n=1 Tax=Pseudanabaena sp. FACHB-1998 TaxID=2692858 RepID=UPI0016811F0B|nr:alpha/beta fold hydrolase [Pseudanabaena sp. FACHB-1998]MBD2178798.1 alpha/beta fold hydrolase [Pseudanabaena sp. FACHB-1998]